MSELEIEIVPTLKDNYVYLLHDEETGQTAAIDPGEVEPVLNALDAKGWKLTHIFNTHHHWDHTDGNLELKDKTNSEICGFKGDEHRIPGIDIRLEDAKEYQFGNSKFTIIHIPGHTLGAIAFFFADEGWVFTGDTLFPMGCGRLFEGTPEQMFASLNKIVELPADTKVYGGHEYTVKNAEFSLTIEPNNKDLLTKYKKSKALREENLPTYPSTIKEELETNPFLRADSRDIRSTLGMENSSDLEVFTEIRTRKNSF